MFDHFIRFSAAANPLNGGVMMKDHMGFPITRGRRLRRNELIRSMVRETRLSPKNFIYPLFVCPGEGVKHEISSMPGNYHLSVDKMVEECREVASLGIPAVILFGLPESKDEV